MADIRLSVWNPLTMVGGSPILRAVFKVELIVSRFSESAKIEQEKSMVASKTADRPKHPREGWDVKFKEMAGNGDDVLLDQFASTTWDEDEWEWELCDDDKSKGMFFTRET